MNISQAIKLLEQVTGTFKGTRSDHVQIQEALNALKAALEPKPYEPAEEPAKPPKS